MSGKKADDDGYPPPTATSDDFAWMLDLMHRGFWTQDALGKMPDECRPFSSTNFAKSSDADKKSRVEHFATQLQQRGFSTVLLCPEVAHKDWEEPYVLCESCATTDGRCQSKLTKWSPETTTAESESELSSDDDDDSESEESEDDSEIEVHSCYVCGPVGLDKPSRVVWRCEECNCWTSTYCDPCYLDKLKFRSLHCSLGDVLPPAMCGIQQMLDLEPTTKASLKSLAGASDGYKYIEGDKEIFHWSGGSRDLVSPDRFGQESDIGKLRSRLLGLGADIISTILQLRLQLPTPTVVRYWGPARYYVYPGREDDGEHTADAYGNVEMSRKEKENVDQWLYWGLTCMDTSLLSVFRYLPKAGPLHCEGHKDKGLLTIVLNPHGLEALVDGKWVPMDVDEQGRPLGSNRAVVFPGLTLEKATGGIIRATEHRVRNVGERMSIVAKIRCHPDAQVDVPWALRKVRPDSSLQSFTVSDMLATLGINGKSVNKETILAPPTNKLDSTSSVRPIKKPKREHIFDATTNCSGLAALPMEVLTQILSSLGVISLGRLACVNKWLNRLATHEYPWVLAANKAGLDWTTSVTALPANTPVRWNVLLGPRLSILEKNATISLWLTTEANYGFTHGAAIGDDLPVPISKHTNSTKVLVDQRTPLSRVVAAFIQKQFSDEEREPLVHQGRPASWHDDWYQEDGKRVNLNLTAWHHQLSDGDILAFSRNDNFLSD